MARAPCKRVVLTNYSSNRDNRTYGNRIEKNRKLTPCLIKLLKCQRSANFREVYRYSTPRFIIFVVIVGIMLLPLRGVIAKAKEALPLARQTADALKNQDLLATKDGLAKTRIKATELSKEYSKVMPLSYIPF